MPRDYHHDYRSRCIYHITITKTRGIPDFSRIEGPLSALNIVRTPLGQIIEENLTAISTLHPNLRQLQYVIMPDHIHFILFAIANLPKVLGSYIGMLKVKIHQGATTTGIISSGKVFNPDFYDRILRPYHSLDVIFNYIRRNPYRLAVRKNNPDFFRRITGIYIDSTPFQAYGNIQLLANPFKEQVVVHRRDSPEIREQNHDRWLYTATNGGVLISPFISKDEKNIRKEAETNGGKLIVLYTSAFRERFKPAAHDFALCEKGRLLIIAPMQDLPDSRQTFLYLNSIATKLSQNKFRLI